jgi:hypothetical protein
MSTLRQGTIVVVVVVVAGDRGTSFAVDTPTEEEGNECSTAEVVRVPPLVRSLGPDVGGWPVNRVMIPEKRPCLGGSAAVECAGTPAEREVDERDAGGCLESPVAAAAATAAGGF